MSKEKVAYLPGVNRAIIERLAAAKSPAEFEKIAGVEKRKIEKKLDALIPSFLNRKVSETELLQSVEDLSTVDLAKKNMRKWFGEGK